MVIAAFCGTGKSFFAAKNPDRVTDFVAMPYKYFLDSEAEEESELSKANPGHVRRPEWPLNYLEAIQETDAEGRLLLIPSDRWVLELLYEENIPYILIYPHCGAKSVYHQRFIERGNSEAFIDIFIGSWDIFLDVLEKDPCDRHVVLQPHQFLSDAIRSGDATCGYREFVNKWIIL